LWSEAVIGRYTQPVYFSVDYVGLVQRCTDKRSKDVLDGPFQRHGSGQQPFGLMAGAQRAQVSAAALPEQQLVHVSQDWRVVRPKFSVLVHDP